MLDCLDVYHDPEPRDAALNMAMDEAFLESATTPTLRYYRWKQPALSFGYFGSFADVAEQHEHREIVRRWTGGGIVPHGNDFTYSAFIPKAHPLLARSSLEIYALFHDAICRALARSGLSATLAPSVTPKVSEHCFANPVRADVLCEGQKIAGAAHRRSRLGLLHQGSIQLPTLRADFPEAFATALCPRSRKPEN